MEQHRFRFPAYSERSLHGVRWCLFDYSDVQDVAHVEGDVVAVSFVGEPRSEEWLEHLSASGYELAPVAELANARA